MFSGPPAIGVCLKDPVELVGDYDSQRWGESDSCRGRTPKTGVMRELLECG
jgi:hypothetical protein